MQKLQLTIPEPCHENWQQMTPTEQGRFCNACAKEVIDFSTMTDMQVLNYFTNLTNEKVCGRALPEQLDRTISRPEPKKKKLFWYWNYVVMFFMFFSKTNTVKAQGGIKAVCNARATSDAELDKIKNDDINKVQANINNALAGKVGEVAVTANRVITGKVTDVNGNPVPFASVKIKETYKGTIADAYGIYSLKVNPNSILVISGSGFKDAEAPVGTQSFINAVMEKSGIEVKEVVVTVAMGAVKIRSDVAFFVKDIQTGLPVNNAKLVIVKTSNDDTTIAFTDVKGNYRAKMINIIPNYDVKVMADGYQNYEFTIAENDFRNGKKEWEVLLRKKEVRVPGASLRSQSAAATGKQTVVRLGGVQAIDVSKGPIYVVDGTVMPRNPDNNINPDDVDKIETIQGPAAAALFGTDGANGAIVITTRKSKEIKLKEVVVTSDYGRTIKGAMAGGISYITGYQESLLGDTIAAVKTLLTDSIKIYPNPVQRGNEFSVRLKLKQPGNNYSILITDAAGRVLAQQKFSATSKEHTEKITTGNRWAAGIYYIRIFDAQNKLISKSSFVFQ